MKFVTIFLLFAIGATSAHPKGGHHQTSKNNYTTPQSLSENYNFTETHGLEHVNVTDLSYKYTPGGGGKKNHGGTNDHHGEPSQVTKGDHQAHPSTITTNERGSLWNLVDNLLKSVVRLGKPEPVVITW